MAIDFVALATEITTDPLGLDYALHLTTGNDQAIADILSLVRVTMPIELLNVDMGGLIKGLDLDEVKAMAPSESEIFLALLGRDLVPGKTIGELALFFGAATANRAFLLAAKDRDGSRAEQLFGIGTRVSPLDVARALGRF